MNIFKSLSYVLSTNVNLYALKCVSLTNLVQWYKSLNINKKFKSIINTHHGFSRSTYIYPFTDSANIRMHNSNWIDRKIDVTDILFLLVQKKQQTHDWILIGSGPNVLGILECTCGHCFYNNRLFIFYIKDPQEHCKNKSQIQGTIYAISSDVLFVEWPVQFTKVLS